MLETCLATVLHDPPGHLLGPATRLWPILTTRFGAVAMHATTTTAPAWLEFLDQQGVPYQMSEADPAAIGEHRRRALQVALDHASPSVLCADLEQMLGWLARDPADLDRALRHAQRCDCLVVGRTAAALQACPEHVRASHELVNRICGLLSGRAWDVTLSVRGLSRHAAQLVVDCCDERGVGSDVAWPLLCDIHGLGLGYLESAAAQGGVANETEARLDADPLAWMSEVEVVARHVDALRPFVDYYQGAAGAAPGPAAAVARPAARS